MSESKGRSGIIKFIFSLVLTLGAGAVAGLFSKDAGLIYNQLALPPFAPPSWIFSPVWTILYILMGIAFFLVISKGMKSPNVSSAVSYFVTQLIFNILWSVFFFALNLHAAALVDIIILLLYIIITTFKFFKVSKPAGILMIPYLAWVAFAAVLNFAIVMLNG